MAARRILIVQSSPEASQELAQYFNRRGDQTWETADAAQAQTQLAELQPDLALVDLHLPGDAWKDLLPGSQTGSTTRFIVTSRRPDYRRELQARELGANAFLRAPFTSPWIEKAVAQVANWAQPANQRLPTTSAEPILMRVRLPVRVKITFPYVLLAILIALAGAYLVSQLILESVQERFNNQLIGTGKQSADWMVQEESRLLETLRLVSNTSGVAAAIQAGDADSLQQMALPLAVNTKEEAVEILDKQGTSVLSLHHTPDGGLADYTTSRGETLFAQWNFVQTVLNGQTDQGRDKYAGMEYTPWGDYFYVSGPVHAADRSLVGAVLVGVSLPTMVRQMSQDNLAETTVYDANGVPVASTLFSNLAGATPLSPHQATSVLAGQASSSLVRSLSLASVSYSEIVGPLKARGDQTMGLLGVALPQSFLIATNRITLTQIFLLAAGAFLLVILIGVIIANQITNPLLRIVKASTEVARGNLEVKVETKGNDEVAVLSHTFNAMVVGLQEGSIYRDLLGRTVSPEVREQLRQTFSSGNLHLEGQQAVTTVLLSDIRGFTPLCEEVDPATVFKWLNEYFGRLVPLITDNNGVVNKFDGDAMLAFFGILPRLLSPKQTAYAGCLAAVEMLKAIEELNRKRSERGEPPLATGIGVNTGLVTAGGMGTTDRLHYTIIGDTVNSTQRLESLTRTLFEGTGVIISQATYEALSEFRQEFKIEELGKHEVKGKSDEMTVYRLLGRADPP